MAFSQKNANYLRRNEIKDPALREALDDIASKIHAGLQQVNATPDGQTPTPPAISGINVLGADGIFDVQLQDNNNVARGIRYFLEYSLTPNFQQPTVIDMGTTRNWRGHLGNQTFYWRGFSQYPTSKPSPPLHFGGILNPTPVTGGGNAGPAPQPSTGSGTAPGNGLLGGEGFGKLPNRNSQSQRSSL